MKKLFFLPFYLFIFVINLKAQSSWQVLNTGTSLDLSTIQCFGKDTLFIFGDDGLVLSSTNGGTNFSSTLHTSAGNASVGYFKTIDTGFQSSGSGIVYRTVNGGQNWMPSGSCSCLITSMCFANSLNGIYAGLSGVYRTVDGGQTWANSPLTPYSAPKKMVSLSSSTFMYPYKNYFFRSYDAGNSFVIDTLNYNSNYALTGLSFVINTVGYMGVGDGKILKTTDEGLHWTLVGSVGDVIRDVLFIDEQQGYAIATSQSNAIYKTSNGGLSWAVDYTGNSVLEKMAADKLSVYVSGQQGIVLKKLVYPTSVQYAQINSIQVYPNPVTERLYIMPPVLGSEVSIIGMDGVIKWSSPLESASALDISFLAPGVYCLKITRGGEYSFHRFIKN